MHCNVNDCDETLIDQTQSNILLWNYIHHSECYVLHVGKRVKKNHGHIHGDTWNQKEDVELVNRWKRPALNRHRMESRRYKWAHHRPNGPILSTVLVDTVNDNTLIHVFYSVPYNYWINVPRNIVNDIVSSLWL